jgi:hypothetical protein
MTSMVAGVLGLACLTTLGGCFDNDPGLQERLIRSQVELEETKQKLQDAQRALDKAQASLKAQAAATPTPAVATATPTSEQLNDGYLAAAKEMRAQLASELTGYSIVNCTLYQVNTVAAMPYTSKVALALRSDKGQQYKIEMPVGADAAGKWKFPTTQEIVDNINKNPPKAIASNTQGVGGSAGNPQEGQRPKQFEPRGQDRPSAPPPVSGVGDGNVDTVTLNWSQSQTRSSTAGRAPAIPPPAPTSMSGGRTADQRAPIAPRPSSQPQPATPTQPAPAMQADQSVLVTF